MMDYTMFQKVVKMQIRDYLPESFKDAEVEIKSVTKVNKVKDSLIIRADDERVVPNFYLDDLYENYKETQDLEAVLHSVADAYVKHLENGREMKIPEFTKEFICENVVMAMINTQSNREMLAGIPHRDINDCSIVYRVMVDKSGDGIATAVVGNDMAESVGLTEEELFLAATENTKRLLPVKIQSMNEIMMGMMMAEGMPKEIAEEMFSSMSPQDAPTMWIITNDRGVNGAVNMLYDENLQHLAKELKDDLYILPSSIHEVICIPASMGDPKVLAEMVQEVNATVVSLEERLSNQVYHYDKDLRKSKLKELSSRRSVQSIKPSLGKIKVYARGWLNYYGIASMKNNIDDINGWLYHRIRMCIWKQWKKPKTKIRNLMKMGVPMELAWQAGNSRRGHWFTTHTVAVNMAMTKERLINSGFYDLAAAYQSVHVNY